MAEDQNQEQDDVFSTKESLFSKNGNGVSRDNIASHSDLLDRFNEYEEPRRIIRKQSNDDLNNYKDNDDLGNNTQKQLQSTDNDNDSIEFNYDLWAPSSTRLPRKNSTSSLRSVFQFQRGYSEKYYQDDPIGASSFTSPSAFQQPHNKTFLHKSKQHTQRTSSISSSTKFMFGRTRSHSRSGIQERITSPIEISKYGFGDGNLEHDDVLSSSSFTSSINSISSTSHYNNVPSNRDSIASSRKSGARKWFSFSNLWSHRQNLTNILAMPKSRLSVTSLFTPSSGAGKENNDSSSSSNDVTPTEGKNYAFCKQPCSPTPSCVTISGDFRSSPGNSKDFPLYSLSSNSCATAVTYRRANTLGQSSSSTAHPYIPRSSDTNRFSCGEFFPSGANATSASTGYLGPDFQCHFYPNNHTRNPVPFGGDGLFDVHEGSKNGNSGLGFRGSTGDLGNAATTQALFMKSSSILENSKGCNGRSLPTLLEAMECATNFNGGISSDGNTGGDRTETLTVTSVAELIYEEFVVFTGAKTIDDHYILILPDRGNFQTLGESDYRRLMSYLASVPTMQDAESGFVIIIDRRNDKWNSVKTALIRISTYFPATVHRVFVLRPVGFLQKALSEVSTKLFRIENLRFRLTVCNNVTDLLAYVDSTQLPSELGGLLLYEKVKWVQERVEIESFQQALQTLSKCLKRYTESFHDVEYPNDVTSTERFIRTKEEEYDSLRKDLSEACNHGENLLARLKNSGTAGVSRIDLRNQERNSSSGLNNRRSGTQLVNIVSIERFILQIDETQKLFTHFWSKEKNELENYLELRRFEQDFRELQASFDTNLQCLNEIPEMGEDLKHSDCLVAETQNFEEITSSDLQKAAELEQIGRNIVEMNQSATDIVEPKCTELSRVALNFKHILQDKIKKQKQWREVQSSIEKANRICTEGMDLVTSQQMSESTQDSPDWDIMMNELDSYQKRLESQLESLVSFKSSISNCGNNVATQCKVLVKQVIKRMEEVQGMCSKRQAFITQQREIQTQHPKLKSLNSGTSWTSMDLKSFKTPLHQQSSSETGLGDSLDGSCFSSLSSSTNSYGNGSSNEYLRETCDIRRGHILQELLQTEKSYVEEIGSVLNGYRDIALNSNISHISVTLPPQLVEDEKPCAHKISVLFCNLDEIYSFHSKLFLPDLQNCIQSIEVVGLCFIQRHSDFLAIYSEYCQLMPASETLLKEIGKTHPWFLKCQEKLGQQLPLSSYLLKPVQRITKYQLLLRDLVKNSEHCNGYSEIVEALECMLIVLKSVNDGMHQLAIRGYPMKLPEEGPLLLQGSFTIWMETSKNRLRLKGHQRYLFLYQKSILMCKKIGTGSTVYYEFKNKINMSEIGMTEALKGSASTKKFEIWVQGREQVFVLQAETQELKEIWVKAIKNLLLEQLESLRVRFDLKNPMIICST